MNIFGWRPFPAQQIEEASASSASASDDDINLVMFQVLTDLEHCGDRLTARVTEYSSNFQSGMEQPTDFDFLNVPH